MDNIFDIGSLSVDFDTMERTNPIFNTAKMTLFQLADNMPELAALSEFSAEQQAAIKQAMTRCAYWKITPISSTEVDTSDSKTTDFDVKASVSGGTLDIRLFGMGQRSPRASSR